MDLVNEFLNKEFIGGLKGTSTLTDVTIARHGALVGGVKRHLRRIYNEAAGDFGCARSTLLVLILPFCRKVKSDIRVCLIYYCKSV